MYSTIKVFRTTEMPDDVWNHVKEESLYQEDGYYSWWTDINSPLSKYCIENGAEYGEKVLIYHG